MSTITATLADLARSRSIDPDSIDLGPNLDAADMLQDLADGLDAAHDRAADGYAADREEVPDAIVVAFAAVEQAADGLRTAAVLIRGHVGTDLPW